MKVKYTKEILAKAVSKSVSIQDVARQLIGKPVGGNQHQHLRRMILKYGVDTSHFLGRAHNRGQISNKRKSPAEVFIVGMRQKSHLLRRALIESGIQYNCFICLIDKWLGKDINLEIDHINGDSSNNSLENLRFLCPNCHSQTETFGYKGINTRRWQNG